MRAWPRSPLPVPFSGAATSSRTDILGPGTGIHAQTTADLAAPVQAGWAEAQCTAPVKASLLYRDCSQGVPQGEAGVNAASAPASEFVTFAETRTGVATGLLGEPVLVDYAVATLLPVCGFLAPWGTIRVLVWIWARFSEQSIGRGQTAGR